jgi:hypothetical protein
LIVLRRLLFGRAVIVELAKYKQGDGLVVDIVVLVFGHPCNDSKARNKPPRFTEVNLLACVHQHPTDNKSVVWNW